MIRTLCRFPQDKAPHLCIQTSDPVINFSTPPDIKAPRGIVVGNWQPYPSGRSLSVPSYRASQFDRNKLHRLFLYHPDDNKQRRRKETTPVFKSISYDKPSGKDLLTTPSVLLAEYKKRDESAISTAVTQ